MRSFAIAACASAARSARASAAARQAPWRRVRSAAHSGQEPAGSRLLLLLLPTCTLAMATQRRKFQWQRRQKHLCGGVRQRAPCAAGPTPAARGRPQRRRLRSRTRGRPRRPPGPPPARSRRCRARPARAEWRPRRPRGPPRGAPQRSPGGSASRVSPQMPRCVCQDGHSIAALLRQPATSGSWAAWQRPVPALMELHILCFPLSRAAHAAVGALLRHTAQPRLAAGRGRARACRACACVCACSAASCCCSAAAAPCRRAASARAAASASRASASSACRRRGACASGSGRACAQCKRGRWPLPYR